MISVGSDIRSTKDKLSKVTEQYICDAIRNPRPQIESLLRQLRIVRQMNPEQYAALKRTLPYFVCAAFNPPQRLTANFAFTEHFIIDIDHLSEKGLDFLTLRNKLSADSRVMMCFLSPGGDGMKVMFRLKERCYDAGVYKLFYKLFAEELSARYNLQQVVDGRTCDVTRACFISHDPDIYYDPVSEPVDMTRYIDVDNNMDAALFLQHEKEKAEKEQKRQQKEDPKPKEDISDEAMEAIRKTLNPNARPVRPKAPVYVPKELDAVMDGLKLFVSEKGVELYEVVNISYGKKLRFRLGLKMAEINLFFGRRGFSVVQSPRTGTHSEMNQLMAEVVEAFIAEKVMGPVR